MIYHDILNELSDLVDVANSRYPVHHCTVSKNAIFGVELLLNLLLRSEVPIEYRTTVSTDLLALSQICKYEELSEKLKSASENI